MNCLKKPCPNPNVMFMAGYRNALSPEELQMYFGD